MKLNKIRNNTFHRIGDRYAHLFDLDHFLGRSAMDNFEIKRPKGNLKEKDNVSTIEVALPGFEKNEVHLTVKQNRLHVTARKNPSENYKDHFLRKEFHTDTQQRTFELSDHVDQSKITSHFYNGVLNIVLPMKEGFKKEESKQVLVN